MTTESLRAFAARKGNAVSYWHKQKELGRLVMVDVGGKLLVDVEASEARLAVTADPAKAHMAEVNQRQRAMHRGSSAPAPNLPDSPPPASDPQGSKNATYMQAKTAREVYEAKSAQVDYEERTGKLIRADAVRSALASVLSSTRDALMQIPARLSPVLAAENDAARVHDTLQAELHQCLAQLAAAPERLTTGAAQQ